MTLPSAHLKLPPPGSAPGPFQEKWLWGETEGGLSPLHLSSWSWWGAKRSRMLGLGRGQGSYLWLGTKSRKSRTWVASLERMMWPVN